MPWRTLIGLLLVIALAVTLLELAVKWRQDDRVVVPRIPPGAEADPAAHLTIRWLGPPFFPAGEEGLWVETMLEERFNLTLQPVILDAFGYERKKPLMLSSGRVPDIVWEANPDSLRKGADHRFFAEVPPALIARQAPTYYRMLTTEVPHAWLYADIDGRNYGLPTMNLTGAAPRPGIWRADWLRNVGYDGPPETLDAFHDVLRRFTFDDPDGNGLDDTYGMTGDISHWWWASFSEIYGAFGVLPFDWQEVDGEIVWGGVRPETRAALAVLRAWYAEGLIHPDFVTDNSNTGQSIERKFLAGKIGYIGYRARPFELSMTAANTLHLKTLQLNFDNILRTQEGWLATFVADLPAILRDQATVAAAHAWLDDPPPAAREQLTAAFADRFPTVFPAYPHAEALIPRFREMLDAIPEDLRNRLTTEDLRLLLGEDRFPEGIATLPTADEAAVAAALPDEPGPTLPYPARQWSLSLLRDVLFAHLVDFREALRTGGHLATWAEARDAWLAAAALANGTAWDRDGRDRAVAQLEEEPAQALQRTFRASLEAVPFAVDDDHLPTNIRGAAFAWVQREIHAERLPPVCTPGWLPIGPDGHRGVRSWGRAGNIMAFGAETARHPERAVRVLRMFEAFFADRELSFEVFAGRQGVHWEWRDPVEGQGSGTDFVRDYVDPRTGTIVDLKAGNRAHRLMLNAGISFFNPLGRPLAFSDYYGTEQELTFRDKWQREEWALVNALGKSEVLPSATRYLGDLRHYQQTVFAEIIRGSRSLDTFDDFVATWFARGGDILTAEAQQVYERQRRLIAQRRALLDDLAVASPTSSPATEGTP